MKAQQLFKSTNEGFEPVGSWFCGRCGNVYNNEESASRCCCCFECGEPLEQPRRYGDVHEACRKIRNDQAEASAIERAEKLDSKENFSNESTFHR